MIRKYLKKRRLEYKIITIKAELVKILSQPEFTHSEKKAILESSKEHLSNLEAQVCEIKRDLTLQKFRSFFL